jgi:hypothetical protein
LLLLLATLGCDAGTLAAVTGLGVIKDVVDLDDAAKDDEEEEAGRVERGLIVLLGVVKEGAVVTAVTAGIVVVVVVAGLAPTAGNFDFNGASVVAEAGFEPIVLDADAAATALGAIEKRAKLLLPLLDGTGAEEVVESGSGFKLNGREGAVNEEGEKEELGETAPVVVVDLGEAIT